MQVLVICMGRGKLGSLVKHLICVLQGLTVIRIRHDANYYNVSDVLCASFD